MLVFLALAALTAPVPISRVDDLLKADTQLMELDARLRQVERAYDYLNNPTAETNPFVYEPHRPILRDRKKALKAARDQLAESIVDTWT